MAASSSAVNGGEARAATQSSICSGRLAQHEGERHVGEALPSPGRDRGERVEPGGERGVDIRPGRAAGGAAGQQPLGERGENGTAHALVPDRIEEAVLRLAVEERVFRLMDEAGDAEVSQECRRAPRLVRRVGGNADVERLAGADGVGEGAHRLLQRRLRVEAVRVEDVDGVEPHPPQARVEARQQILARAPLAVGARPHAVAGLRGDHELVAVAAEVGRQQPAEGLLR
jgi:hypothetical protein